MRSGDQGEALLPRWIGLDEALELVKQGGDGDSELVELVERSLPFAVPERYLHGDLAWHLHLWFRAIGVKSQPRQICARFERLPNLEAYPLFEKDCLRVPGQEIQELLFGRGQMRKVEPDQKGVVLIDVGVAADAVEDCQLGVPSLIRLLPLDSCPRVPLGVEAMKGPFAATGGAVNYVPPEFPLIRVDRELVMSPRNIPLGLDQFPDKVIKSGAKIVDEVPQDGAQSRGNALRPEGYDIPASLRIVVNSDRIGVSIEKDVAVLVQKLQILPCAIHLDPSAGETGRVATYDPPLDEGIREYVEVLGAAGIETFESCEGGPGHAYPEPTVRFHGEQGEGFRALAVAQSANLPVAELRRTWPLLDDEPTGPWWELTFSRRCIGGLDA